MKEELKKLLEKYLSGDNLAFAVGFLVYCNFVDDIIDCDKPNPEAIIRTFEFGAMLYSSEFYRRNCSVLLPLIKAAGNSYADSVNFENSDEQWKKNYADVLRQVGNEVLCACVEIEKGYEARRGFSLKIREISYKTHHDSEGKPI